MNAQELKGLRERLGLTQKKMADKLFISRVAVAKLEKGENKMGRQTEELARQLVESLAAD